MLFSKIQKVEAAYHELDVQRQEIKNPSMNVKQKLVSTESSLHSQECREHKSSAQFYNYLIWLNKF